MDEKEATFNVKYEIVLYTLVFNARWGCRGLGKGFDRPTPLDEQRPPPEL